MSQLPATLFGRWTHSFEEDAADTKVYRPASFAFPPARGRAGIELHPDGTFVEWTIGRGDAPQPIRGRWQADVMNMNQLRVEFDGDARPARTLEILGGNDQVLRLKNG